MIHLAIRFAHILSAATWLGAALWAPGDARRTLALGKPHVDLLAARIGPTLRLDLWAGAATVVTGLALLLERGGHPRFGIELGLLVSLARLGLFALALAPAWRAAVAAIAAGDLAPAQGHARRMAMLSGIGHALWVIALAGMVFPW